MILLPKSFKCERAALRFLFLHSGQDKGCWICRFGWQGCKWCAATINDDIIFTCLHVLFSLLGRCNITNNGLHWGNWKPGIILCLAERKNELNKQSPLISQPQVGDVHLSRCGVFPSTCFGFPPDSSTGLMGGVGRLVGSFAVHACLAVARWGVVILVCRLGHAFFLSSLLWLL